MDEKSFGCIVEGLAASGVDSITALGSTGSAASLDTGERARVAALAVRHAGPVPVHVGVGALRTSDVLRNIGAAEDAGATGVLLAPMSYQPLTDDEVFELFRAAVAHTALPVVVYDNPGTTHFAFSLELYARIAALPGIASAASDRLAPLWDLFDAHGGSMRIIAVIAERLGTVAADTLPRPILGLNGAERERVIAVVEELGLI